MGEALRTCIGCRKKGQKQDFIRIVKDSNNELNIDISKKRQTRGAYICMDDKCIAILSKSHRLRKLFNVEDDSKIIEKLKDFLENEI